MFVFENYLKLTPTICKFVAKISHKESGDLSNVFLADSPFVSISIDLSKFSVNQSNQAHTVNCAGYNYDHHRDLGP